MLRQCGEICLLVVFLIVTNMAFTDERRVENERSTGLSSSRTQTTISQTSNTLSTNDYAPPEVGSVEWEEYRRRLRDAILAGEIPIEKWKSSLSQYFLENHYSPIHLQMWDMIFQEQREYSDELVLYSITFHVIALLEELKKPEPFPESILLTSKQLFQSLDIVRESHKSQVLRIMDEYLKKSSLRIDELWVKLIRTISGGDVNTPLSQVPPMLYECIIYLCLAFDAYLPPKDFLKHIVLPEPMNSFYKDTGLLIFEGGGLTDLHYRSLVSILSSFPPTLHQIQAIIVPETVGGISATRLLIPTNYGVIVDIPFIPMDVMSDPDEFPFRIGKQIAPEFSLQAVVQVIRAIQWVQFRLRPELALRRERLLLSMNPRAYNYVRQTVHPSLFLSAPEELLPQAGYVWCLNTDKALQMANDLLRVRQHFATDVFMLLADLLSQGRDVTLTFYMNEGGILNVREAPVIRIPVDEGFPAVVGVLPERIIPERYLNFKSDISSHGQITEKDKVITSTPYSFSSGVQRMNQETPVPFSENEW